MRLLKLILLLLPLDLLAHAGHDAQLIHTGARYWLYSMACLILLLLAVPVVRRMEFRRKREKSTTLDD